MYASDVHRWCTWMLHRYTTAVFTYAAPDQKTCTPVMYTAGAHGRRTGMPWRFSPMLLLTKNMYAGDVHHRCTWMPHRYAMAVFTYAAPDQKTCMPAMYTASAHGRRTGTPQRFSPMLLLTKKHVRRRCTLPVHMDAAQVRHGGFHLRCS